MTPDSDLVNTVLQGHPSAYAELVARYERSVRAITYHILRDHHTAEDATQDAFVAAYQSLPSLRNPASFRPYLFKIATRHARHLSRARRPVLSLANDHPAPASPFSPDHTQLLNALSRLSTAERDLILLHHFDGHDTPTCSRLLNRPIGTLTKQLSRIYTRLRTLLKEDPR
ncbi:MAG TPA: sigma-70 family RNA polymerase sigma factor [Tepidisphaeraceae bacterium]|nr:sigma-70 family RNA polymerase sigma factor [Tepidisphaeraceae bacterium]